MKEFWNGHLFLIVLLRAQENEFNQTVLCIQRGGVYNVHQSRVIYFVRGHFGLCF